MESRSKGRIVLNARKILIQKFNRSRAQILLFTSLGIFFHPNLKSQSGISFQNVADQYGIAQVVNSHEWGSGVSTFDFNGDGLDDITLCNDGNPLFFINNGEGFNEFNANLNLGNSTTKQVLWVDYDNDHDYDILLVCWPGQIQLFQNQGDLTFVNVSQEAGVPLTVSPNMSANFGDYDRDGFLDLFISRFIFTSPDPDDANFMCRLYKNQGNGTFTDVTAEAQLEVNPTNAFQAVWLDYNNDLWPDLHIAVDKLPGNHFFENNGNDTFTERTDEYGIAFPNNEIMSNTVADYNNDGFLDIFMTNAGVAEQPTLLIQNNSGQGFSSVGPEVGLAIQEFSWGALWIDADNDGWDDLYFCTPTSNNNPFFKNENGQVFTPMYEAFESESHPPSFAVAKGDFNNDGYSDVIVQSQAPDQTMYFQNQSTPENNFVKITLQGTVSNTMAVGSWIKVYCGESEKSVYTLCGENYLAQNSQHQVIGLKNSEVIDSVYVTYPSGHTDHYYALSVNQSYNFIEGETYNVSITASETEVCQGDSISLSAGQHAQYTWNTGDTIRTIQVEESGNYQVTVWNEFGISDTASIEISVHPNPVVNEIISPNLCFGDSLAEITLINQTGVDADTVIWNSEETGAFIDSLPEGLYSYIFTDLNGCTYSDSVVITSPSELMVFINASATDPNQSNGVITVTSFGGTPPYSIYLDQEPVESTITDLDVGVYNVLVIDNNGCEKDSIVNIESTLSTGALKGENTARIYPVPSKGVIQIDSNEKIRNIFVRDALGRLVYKTSEPQSHVDLSHLKQGTYYVKLEFENKTAFIQKIIIF